MSFLLDTCALSEMTKLSPNAAVIEFLEATDSDELFLPAISIGEVEKGVHLMPMGKRREEHREWLEIVELYFDGNVLPVDDDVAKALGRIAAKCRLRGAGVSVPDGLIAATAEVHGLTLVTLNRKDFEPTDVDIHAFS